MTSAGPRPTYTMPPLPPQTHTDTPPHMHAHTHSCVEDFNTFSTHLQRVPMLSPSCIVPVPKTGQCLTSHLMNTLEKPVLEQLRPMIKLFSDPLQFHPSMPTGHGAKGPLCQRSATLGRLPLNPHPLTLTLNLTSQAAGGLLPWAD